jgi:hypothetical protein
VLRTALVRLCGIAIAVLAASIALTFALVSWQASRYGDSTVYLGMSQLQLWLVGLANAAAVVGGTLFWNLVVTLFLTNRYPVGRWTYWIGFVVIALWATIVAIASIRPITDAGLAGLGVLLTWPITVFCALVGLAEVLVRRWMSRSRVAPDVSGSEIADGP